MTKQQRRDADRSREVDALDLQTRGSGLFSCGRCGSMVYVPADGGGCPCCGYHTRSECTGTAEGVTYRHPTIEEVGRGHTTEDDNV